MDFFIYFLLTIIGFAVAIYVVIATIKYKISKTIGRDNLNNIVDAIKSTKDLELEEYSREKSVSGITRLLEPSIIRDFPDFNKELLFKKVEKNLNEIFDAIETKNIAHVTKDEDLILLRDSVSNTIKEINDQKIDINYSDVKFHNHAIKAYDKRDGVATITTSSTLEYFYSKTGNKKSSDVKKQTRYTCKFIYIFDETKVKGELNVLTIRCPNCGAPLRGLGNLKCIYCGSDIQPINLKAWKMSGYSEDYAE